MAPVTPQIGSSSRKGAEGAIVVSSLVVVSLYAYRKLIEPAANAKGTEPALRKIIGIEPKPAGAAQFAVAFGFVFFTLSVVGVAAPELGSALAILIAVGYTLTNGASVFADITTQVSEKSAAPAPAPAKAKS